MEIKLIRNEKGDRTFGKIYINDTYVCDTLEPPYFGTKQSDEVEKIKATKKGNTAIPIGTYVVDVNTISPKFRNRTWALRYSGIIPWVKDVRGFDRILIHVGNYASQYGKSDSNGCILVGTRFQQRLTNSIICYNKLMDEYLMPAREKNELITITIV